MHVWALSLWLYRNLLVDYFIPALLGFPNSVSTAGYSLQHWSVLWDSREVSPLSEYNSSTVWMGNRVSFFFRLTHWLNKKEKLTHLWVAFDSLEIHQVIKETRWLILHHSKLI